VRKVILLVVLFVIVVAAGGLGYFVHSLSVDRDALDYRNRVEFIWSGPPPFEPSDQERATIATQKHWIVRLLQKFTNTPGEKPYLVTFLAPGASTHPAMIVMPGGSYILRSEKAEGIDVAHWLNSIGISAFVLNYRLERHPAPLSDAQRSIQFVRANSLRLQIDPQRIGVLGFSAGGHLAATAGTNYLAANPQSPDPIERVSSKPTVIVLAYPVISFGELAHAPSRDMLIGPNPPPALVKLLSAENNVTAETPPTFLWAAKTDGTVDYRNSQMFADALTLHGVRHEYHLFPEGRHGSGLSDKEKYAYEWPALCKSWLEQTGFLDRKKI
jgi:acetyl esterase/lipase